MNTIQKAAFAASAFAITLVGAALVTAPMAFARPEPIVTLTASATPALHLALAGHTESLQ
jgi:hypothetical protein